MYDFIYIFFFRYFQCRKEADPQDAAIYGVMVAIFFHLFLLLNVFTSLTEVNILTFFFGEGHNKYFWLPLVIVFMFLIYRFYKNRSEKIIEKYANKENIFNWQNTLIIILITVGPLLLGIYLLNND